MGTKRTAEKFRAEFPVLDDLVHLAACSQGALSRRLEAALTALTGSMRERGAPWESGWMDQVERARAGFAELIGAAPEEVAVLPSASEAAFQVASARDWSRRPGLVTTDLEFPSIAHVWLAQGADVRYAADDGTTIDAQAYADVLSADTSLVSVPLVCYKNGARSPVREVADLAHARGARVFVDAYQGAGVVPVNVDDLGCDYLVAGALKYLLGLPGIAFLYARGGVPDERPPTLTGWFGRRNPFAFDPRGLDHPETARRFEVGTPAIPSAYGANAGFSLLREIDQEAAFTHVAGLVDDLAARLTAAGETLLSPVGTAARGPMVALADDDPVALAGYLSDRRIITAPRGRALRISLHYYTNAADIAAVTTAIADYRREVR